jgi:hypothetical protein
MSLVWQLKKKGDSAILLTIYVTAVCRVYVRACVRFCVFALLAFHLPPSDP